VLVLLSGGTVVEVSAPSKEVLFNTDKLTLVVFTVDVIEEATAMVVFLISELNTTLVLFVLITTVALT
jgi:hypothetical protein